MLKIYVALVLALSLGCLAQPPRRRVLVAQRRIGAARTTPQPYGRPTESANDPRYHYPTSTRPAPDQHPTSTRPVPDQYPTSPRSVQVVKPSTKYRRKPKQTYYPKVISFYQRPTTNNGYEFKYITDDGVQRAERGYLSETGVWTVEGSVTSLSEDNVAVVQSYIADAAGYKSSVRTYTPEKYRSLDDFLPWSSSEDLSFEDNRLGSGVISSLVGG